MAGRFITPLRCELVSENPDTWRLLESLVYQPARGCLVVVPPGFVSDFASVPRWPLVYWLCGGLAKAAAVLHDWMYTRPVTVARARADAIFSEAAGVSGVAGWRRGVAWAGVRVFGAGRYQVGPA